MTWHTHDHMSEMCQTLRIMKCSLHIVYNTISCLNAKRVQMFIAMAVFISYSTKQCVISCVDTSTWVAQWTLNVWHVVHDDIVACTLLKCSMSSDGTEDNYLWGESNDDNRNSDMEWIWWWTCTSASTITNCYVFPIFTFVTVFPNSCTLDTTLCTLI